MIHSFRSHAAVWENIAGWKMKPGMYIFELTPGAGYPIFIKKYEHIFI
jgi:hypothetical protein